jgi:hypothetical protein
MWSSILESEKTLDNVEGLIYSQPSNGVIKTTADYLLDPFYYHVYTRATCTYQ